MKKILPTFKSTECEWEVFAANDNVIVFPKYSDELFTHSFLGTVIDKNATYIIVEDQEGDCFTVDPDQIEFHTMKKDDPNLYPKGEVVNVTVDSDDVLTENFRGTIQGIRYVGEEFFVQVKPDDSDEVWDFRTDQISPNTDAIMHAESHQ